jgi:hypothetical protein
MSISDAEVRNKVWNKSDGHCYYCGVKIIPFGRDDNSYSVDHVIPRVRGGTDDIENLVPCCRRCNSSKRDKGLFSWISEIRNEHDGICYHELMRLPFPKTAWEDPLE